MTDMEKAPHFLPNESGTKREAAKTVVYTEDDLVGPRAGQFVGGDHAPTVDRSLHQ
ncbi:hypothetical protein Axi01nite_41520 [Actinoplanes xinjiangensis]|nr:hypothetical protein Axi01nite_41520 [Actinoplanes xinjiangensis]